MSETLPLPLARDLTFAKQVDQASIDDLTKEILKINENDRLLVNLYRAYGLTYVPKPINIYIDSYGGAVYQIFGLIALIRTSITPVHTYVTGCAMSCGFLLLVAGHKRFGYKLSTGLWHSITSGFWGKLGDLKIELKETKRLGKLADDIILEYTKISKSKLKDIIKLKEDWYLPSDEMLALGVIDEIIL